MDVDFREGRTMISLTIITDEMLEEASIPASDKEYIKEIREHNLFIELKSSLFKNLTDQGIDYVLFENEKQSWDEGYEIALQNSVDRLQNKFKSLKTLKTEEDMLVVSEEFINGFALAIEELNYLKNL